MARASSARGRRWRARSGRRRSGRSCCRGSPRAASGISTRRARSWPPPSPGRPGPDWRCRPATGEELIGLLRAMASLQSWAGAGLLGMIRALIRDDDPAFLAVPRHGDLPDEWDDSLVHEIALALAVSAPSAGKTTRAAWELGARLPGVELLLKDGTLDLPRARLVAEVFEDLSDENAAKAEELLLPQLTEPPRKTYTQIERLATAIAAEVDPDLVERRRKAAEKHRSRVHDVPRAVRHRRPVGPGPADRPDAGRVRARQRPRRGCTRSPACSRRRGWTGCGRPPTSTSSTTSPLRIGSPTGGSAPTTPPDDARTTARTTTPTPADDNARRRARPGDAAPDAPDGRRRRVCARTPGPAGRVRLPLRRVRRPLRAARRQPLPGRRRTRRRRTRRWRTRRRANRRRANRTATAPSGPGSGGPRGGGGRPQPAAPLTRRGQAPAATGDRPRQHRDRRFCDPPAGPPADADRPGVPARHPPRPGRAARRGTRPGHPRPGPVPRPGRHRRPQPPHHHLHHGHRRRRHRDRPRLRQTRPPRRARPAGPPPPLVALPARINLTITTARLVRLRAAGPATRHTRHPTPGPPGPPGQRRTGWAFAPRAPDAGHAARRPATWCGAWALTAARSGLEFTARPRAGARRSTATIATSRTPTSPTPPFATSSRSVTTPAPSRPAPGTPARVILSMRSRTTRAAGPVGATPAREAANATASSSHPAGTSPSPNPAGTSGPPPAAGPTPKARRGTRCDRRGLAGWTARSGRAAVSPLSPRRAA